MSIITCKCSTILNKGLEYLPSFRFWYPWDSWAQSSADTKGWLYYHGNISTLSRNKTNLRQGNSDSSICSTYVSLITASLIVNNLWFWLSLAEIEKFLNLGRIFKVFKIFKKYFRVTECRQWSYILDKTPAAAKSLQSCPTLCDPIDGSPPASTVPGILQARTLEWVAISLSNAWKWKVKVKSLSRVRLTATSWTAAYQAPPPMGFSRLLKAHKKRVLSSGLDLRGQAHLLSWCNIAIVCLS